MPGSRGRRICLPARSGGRGTTQRVVGGVAAVDSRGSHATLWINAFYPSTRPRMVPLSCADGPSRKSCEARRSKAPPLQGRGWGGACGAECSLTPVRRVHNPHPNPSPEGEGLTPGDLSKGPAKAGEANQRPGSPSPGRRSRRQARTISFQQPLTPPGPTVEQLWMPPRPTYSSASERAAQLVLSGSSRVAESRSSRGIR
jgi:hypothetical protein